MLDVRRLRVLLAVREQGGVTAAARALAFTSPAVSQQIAALERQVGTALLDRSSRPTRLTAAGERLADHAVTVLAGLEAAAADVAALAHDGPSGTVRIGTIPTAGQAILPPAVEAVRTRAPHLRVHVEQLEPEDGLPAVARGDLDLAIASEYAMTPRRPDRHRLERHDIGVEPLVVAVPTGHRHAGATVALDRLRDETWLAALPGSTCHVMLRRACALAGFEPVEGGHVGEFAMTLALVAAGAGVALVPSIAVPAPSARPGVRILTVEDPGVERTLYVVLRRGTLGHPAVRTMLDAVREAGRTRLVAV
jgi:DNA-binding transcriptional LysR family regulator